MTVDLTNPDCALDQELVLRGVEESLGQSIFTPMSRLDPELMLREIAAATGYQFATAVRLDPALLLLQIRAALAGGGPSTTPRAATLGSYLGSFPNGLSGDGTVLTGLVYDADNEYACYWTNGGQTLTVLQPISGGPSNPDGFATSASTDGSIVVGYTAASDGFSRAVLWTNNGAPFVLDINEQATQGAAAEACSADGLTIVGHLNTDDGLLPARWSDGVLTVLAHPTNGGDARACSADGIKIVGFVFDDSRNSHAALWDGDVDPVQLPGGDFSAAYGVSSDGSIIVGSVTGDGAGRAVYWQDGTMFRFEEPPDTSNSGCTGISDDGTVAVGFGVISGVTRAMMWRNGVVTPLGVLSDLDPYSEANAVSRDGTTAVGDSNDASDNDITCFWILPT